MGSAVDVFVAMSGGVDSSVAAAQLIEQGYRCAGVFMVTHEGGLAAVDEVRAVAERLGIGLHVLDLRDVFEQEVAAYFCGEYAAGRTPNPCVWCNRHIKFGRLWDYAREHGARYLATGHYARIEHDTFGPGLYAAEAPAKDQSYVLAMIPRERLANILLPLGGQGKADTRTEAARRGLPVHQKPDSQEICFIPDQDYVGYLARHGVAVSRPGPVVDVSGQVLGHHEGICRYTIGQRRGLGIALGRPAYVVAVDTQANQVVLGDREDLLAAGLEADHANWLIDPPSGWLEGWIRIRYNHPGVAGRVRPDRDDPTRLTVRFDEPVAAVTPGQAAVLYVSEPAGWRVACGAWIRRSVKP